MIGGLNIVSAICAFVAAGFWLASTRPKLPATLPSAYGGASPEHGQLLAALRRQSMLNAWGAGFAAAAAICQALALSLS